MDLFHRKAVGTDTRNGRDCQFCLQLDPVFGKRPPMDRLVLPNMGDTAAAHLTEDGYVQHLIAELTRKRSTSLRTHELAKSA